MTLVRLGNASFKLRVILVGWLRFLTGTPDTTPFCSSLGQLTRFHSVFGSVLQGQKSLEKSLKAFLDHIMTCPRMTCPSTYDVAHGKYEVAAG